ncbi:MAG: transcription antitermination factor NusB [Gammaproteobacteria bacterium]|nr:MAG: transcription antitermination factor NusB [Gammaproteobacteria bacterium]
MQAIYQWLMGGLDVNALEKQFLEDPESQHASRDYLSELIRGVIDNYDNLADALAPHLSRPLKEVDPVESAVLLIAAYEFRYVLSVPYRAVINEAIELAKIYGAEQGHRFINGVLDKLANDLRAIERQSG